MRKLLKWMVIVLLVLIAIVMIYAVLGKSEVMKLKLESIDLTQIPDGAHIGAYDNYRWSNAVAVTVTAHRITGIKPIKIQDGRDDLAEALIQEVIDRQSPDVDVISGATASSKGLLKAVELALKSAE